MKSKFATLVIYSFFCVSAFAAPASWYQWKSKLNNERYCTQTSPGYGWEQDNGPYKDARCKIRTVVRNDVASTKPDSKLPVMQSSDTSRFPLSTLP
jgi:hypothetical protein